MTEVYKFISGLSHDIMNDVYSEEEERFIGYLIKDDQPKKEIVNALAGKISFQNIGNTKSATSRYFYYQSARSGCIFWMNKEQSLDGLIEIGKGRLNSTTNSSTHIKTSKFSYKTSSKKNVLENIT